MTGPAVQDQRRGPLADHLRLCLGARQPLWRGPVRRVLRGQDEGLLDALLAGVIVDAAFSLALDALPDTVGRSCRGRAPGAAFDRLHGEVVAGQPTFPCRVEIAANLETAAEGFA